MNIQDSINKITEEIEAEAAAFETKRQEIMNGLIITAAVRDEKIAALRDKRDAIVMKEKLKDFPAKLVKEHTHCSICGNEMRPFKYVLENETLRAWACQIGNLKEDHDLIHIK